MARGERLPRSAWGARREKWRRRLKEWASSGDTQAGYCHEHGLDQTTFSGWKRRLGFQSRRACEASRGGGSGSGPRSKGNADAEAVFIPLPPSNLAQAVHAGVIEVGLRNGRTLRVPAGCDIELVAKLSAALELPPTC
jgi:hypothetical protein